MRIAYSLFLLMTILLSACHREGPSVDFIVPDGFRGVFQISPKDGAHPIKLVNGRYIIEVPSSGTLYVDDMRPFRQWHQERAFFKSGSPLPDSILAGDSDSIRLHGLSTDSNDNSWWLVGTDSEKEIFHRMSPFNIPLARPLTPRDAEQGAAANP